MTIKEKREWLGSYSRIVREIDVLCDESEKIRAKIYKFTNIDKITLQEATEKLQAIADAIGERVSGLVEKRRVIKAAIDAVPNERYRELLYYRYIMGMTYEEIADRMFCEIRWVFHLSNKALSFIDVPKEAENG